MATRAGKKAERQSQRHITKSQAKIEKGGMALVDAARIRNQLAEKVVGLEAGPARAAVTKGHRKSVTRPSSPARTGWEIFVRQLACLAPATWPRKTKAAAELTTAETKVIAELTTANEKKADAAAGAEKLRQELEGVICEKEQAITATAAAKKYGEEMVDAVKQEIAEAEKKPQGGFGEEALAATKAQNEAIEVIRAR
ncbi:hypothetical protein V500_02895 [Pseudogymnoascus sp. VKM F-4518 (FW-2643)]|nr:hypothetical protein V500_02895 [Pseudogymnoascus sp. VKM F-4518 (FW-2643)]